MKINQDGFLTQDEEDLVHWIIRKNELTFAWDETEKGKFSEDYFEPIVIPTVEHIPWVLKNIPIPRGSYDKVITAIRDKIKSGIYETSNSSYRSRWFAVLKKDGKSIRLVHDLQPLNQVSIKDSAVPPTIEPYAESFGARSIYTVFDLFIGFDQRELAVQSRDLTTFQTPLGTFRLTSIPMGYTNSMQIFHGDTTFILQDKILDITIQFPSARTNRAPTFRCTESLIKAAEGDETKWPQMAPYVFWAERISIQKSTGFSPYRMAHGVDALLPFDLAEATYLAPPMKPNISTEDLVAMRAQMLQKRPEDLERVKKEVIKARWKSVLQLEKNRRTLEFTFEENDLVLVRNSVVDKELGSKTMPRYLGPMVVIRQTRGNSYILAELDGTISKLKYAAYWLFPYRPRNPNNIQVTKIVSLTDEEMKEFEREISIFGEDNDKN